MNREEWSSDGVGCGLLMAFLAGCFFMNWMLS